MMLHESFEGFGARESEQPLLPVIGPVPVCDWREGLPTIVTPLCTLRELTLDDAPSLFAHLTKEEVARFISPPPATVEGFENFIRWVQRKRAEGKVACFGVVPAGQTKAVGMFQVRVLVEGEVAEWGFALGSAYWGSGIFLACAQPVLDFVFTQIRITRLEARSVIENGRGNGALRKVGAMRAMVLNGSFERHGKLFDQALWIITARAWAEMRAWPDGAH
jgi:ribosomal-protein-alanine N-acetyltransferase